MARLKAGTTRSDADAGTTRSDADAGTTQRDADAGSRLIPRSARLQAGHGPQGTRIGNMLQNMVDALGGRITSWEVIQEGSTYHIRVHVEY